MALCSCPRACQSKDAQLPGRGRRRRGPHLDSPFCRVQGLRRWFGLVSCSMCWDAYYSQGINDEKHASHCQHSFERARPFFSAEAQWRGRDCRLSGRDCTLSTNEPISTTRFPETTRKTRGLEALQPPMPLNPQNLKLQQPQALGAWFRFRSVLGLSVHT